MLVDLPAEQQAFIEGLVASGRFSSAHEAVSEGMRLLISREQVQIGIDQADRDELIDHDMVFAELRARVAVVAKSPRDS